MKVLVWHDKHGEYYYDASTPEAEEASSREILKQMVASRYIEEPEDPYKHIQFSSIDLEQAYLTDEQIEALPTGSLRKEAREHKQALTNRLARYKNEKEEFAELERFLAGETIMSKPWVRRSGPNAGETVPPKPIPALRILEQWADGGEYMRIEVESVWTPEDRDD